MAKLTLSNLSSLTNQNSAITALNNNNSATAAALENTLSRDGTSPNTMASTLDMNSNRIINLPTPTNTTEAARLHEVQQMAAGTFVLAGPGPSTLGGVKSSTAGVNQFATGVDTSGNILYGAASLSVPNPSPTTLGGLKSSTAVTNQFLTSVNTDGTVSRAQPAYADISGLGTAATFNVGTGANNVVQLNGSSKLPAVDGSQLTNLPGANAIVYNALNYSVTGNGSTNDAAAINTFLTTCSTAGAVAYFPGGKVYNCGASQINVPDGLRVMCAPSATFRRSNFGAYFTIVPLISLGNYCHWSGGILDNTAVQATSITSNSIDRGVNKTFTVASGLAISAGDFIRVFATSSQSNYMEGAVVSYSGTTLVLSATFGHGAGTFSNWTIVWGAVFQCALVLSNSIQTLVESVRCTGYWYVGFMMYGAAAGTPCLRSTLRRCVAESVFNRAFYIAGACTSVSIVDCFVAGNGFTDYGINTNTFGTAGINILGFAIIGCTVESCNFQGIMIGDFSYFGRVSDCYVVSIVDSSGVGIGVQAANGHQPSYHNITNCIVNSAGGEAFALFGAGYCQFTNCTAINSGVGYYFGPSSPFNTVESAMYGCLVTACTTGVSIPSGATNIYLSGRSTGNTVNLIDAGTGTINGGFLTLT